MVDIVEVNESAYRAEYSPIAPDKPLCVFLHGFLGTCAEFYHITPQLTDFVNPLLIDHLGHGESSVPSVDSTVDTNRLVGDLVEIIRRFSQEKVFLAGYSMGGRLALHAACARPELFRGMILESTGPGIADPEIRKNRVLTDKNRAEQIQADLRKFVEEWNRMPLFQSGGAPDPEGRLHLEILQKMQNPNGIASMLKGFGSGEMPPVTAIELNNINFPVLLIAGREDVRYVEIQHQMAEELPDVEVQILDDAGHRVHINTPDAYISTLKTFLLSNL